MTGRKGVIHGVIVVKSLDLVNAYVIVLGLLFDSKWWSFAGEGGKDLAATGNAILFEDH